MVYLWGFIEWLVNMGAYFVIVLGLILGDAIINTFPPGQQVAASATVTGIGGSILIFSIRFNLWDIKTIAETGAHKGDLSRVLKSLRPWICIAAVIWTIFGLLSLVETVFSIMQPWHRGVALITLVLVGGVTWVAFIQISNDRYNREMRETWSRQYDGMATFWRQENTKLEKKIKELEEELETYRGSGA